jgi:hypothetical protein
MNLVEAQSVIRGAGGILSLTGEDKADLVPLAGAGWRDHEIAVWVPPENVNGRVRLAASVVVAHWLDAQQRGRESGSTLRGQAGRR